jgi:hypothetical protein
MEFMSRIADQEIRMDELDKKQAEKRRQKIMEERDKEQQRKHVL